VGVLRLRHIADARDTLLLMVTILSNVVMVLFIRIIGSEMYPFFIGFYVWVAMYAIYVAMVLRWQRLRNSPLVHARRGVVLFVGLLILLRLVFIGQTEMISLDALWYLDFGKFMVRGALPYTDFYFPYPPLFAYVICGVMAIAPSVDAFRVISTAADVFVALILWRLARYLLDDRWGSVVLAAYALLPISIIESGWNGHFEPIVNTFLLLSLWFILVGSPVLSGIFLGLGAATKVYPLLVLPVFMFYLGSWKERILLVVSVAVTLGLSYLPLYAASVYSISTPALSVSAIPGASSSAGMVTVVVHLLSSITPIVVLVGLAILAATVAMNRCRKSCDHRSCGSAYYWIVAVLSLVLVSMAVAFGIYPLLPQSLLVYWRYPADIGIVRSITTASTGLMLLIASWKRFSSIRVFDLGPRSLLVLLSATILLMSTLIRNVFYGWYLLWSLPLFFLLKRKPLALTLILCLLLLYPSYTHDNFESLGYNENRVWNEDFAPDAWSVTVNTSGVFDASLVSASFQTAGQHARLTFDTTHVNKSVLPNLTITYRRAVFFRFDESTEFVARIGADWDPTFEAYASLALYYVGTNSTGQPIRRYIIPPTQMFTNLTHILWRHAFSLDGSPPVKGIVRAIVFEVKPMLPTLSGFTIDFMYTTQVGLLNPLWFVTVPNLIAVSLASYVVLRYEAESSHER